MRRNRWILIVAFATGLGIGWCGAPEGERPRPAPAPAPAEAIGEAEWIPAERTAQLCPGAQTCGGRGEPGLPLPVRGL